MAGQLDIQQNLPLTEPTFLILLSLLPDRKHGYAIMKEVRALSHGRVILSTGTLYGSLKRLLEQGWIERVPDSEAPATARERKAYALTDLGHRVLEAETKRLETLVLAAQRRPVKGKA